jgi:hypothetical protein
MSAEERPKKEMVILAYSFSGPYHSLARAIREAKERRGRWNGAEKIFAVRKMISYDQKEKGIKEDLVDEVFLVFDFCPSNNEKEAKETAKGSGEFMRGEVKIFVATEEILWPREEPLRKV